jgi:hypothetical protein
MTMCATTRRGGAIDSSAQHAKDPLARLIHTPSKFVNFQNLSIQGDAE